MSVQDGVERRHEPPPLRPEPLGTDHRDRPMVAGTGVTCQRAHHSGKPPIGDQRKPIDPTHPIEIFSFVAKGEPKAPGPQTRLDPYVVNVGPVDPPQRFPVTQPDAAFVDPQHRPAPPDLDPVAQAVREGEHERGDKTPAHAQRRNVAVSPEIVGMTDAEVKQAQKEAGSCTVDHDTPGCRPIGEELRNGWRGARLIHPALDVDARRRPRCSRRTDG